MFITYIQIEWIDYNPTTEQDMYKITFYNSGEVIKEIECAKSNIASKIEEVLSL